MTTRTKRLVAVAVALLAILGVSVGGFYYMRWQVGQHIGEQIGRALIEPHAVQGVDTQAWTHLTVGMSRESVIGLLGDAPGKHKQAPSEQTTEEELKRLEYWEYNYTYGLLGPGPHPKAYVIYFDRDGKVSAFRSPIN